MTVIVHPSTGPEAWRAGLADPENQWRKGYSARTTAYCWESNTGFPSEVAALLGVDVTLQIAISEHKVPMPGRGKASQCDIFCLARVDDRDMAIAVEAKVNEPFGPTLGEWNPDDAPGKAERLAGICELQALTAPADTNLRYQLFHRTAAAIVEARRWHRRHAAVIVHSFAQDHRWFSDFDNFAKLFSMNLAPGRAATTVLPDGLSLTLGWATGDPIYLDR